jgi:hypothetical protein
VSCLSRPAASRLRNERLVPSPSAMANELGLRNVSFEVND